MAAVFLSTATTFLPRILSSSSSSTSSPSSSLSSSSSSTLTTLTPVSTYRQCLKRQLRVCRAVIESQPSSSNLSKRSLTLSLTSTFLLFLSGKGLSDANAAILEADDDEELLEKVKRDRKKRLEKQELISSSNRETGRFL